MPSAFDQRPMASGEDGDRLEVKPGQSRILPALLAQHGRQLPANFARNL